MTTRQRIDLLARAYPRLFPREELLRLVRTQLGHIDALDRWITRDGVRFRAVRPRIIYHLCSGNLAISACTSIAYGLILGSGNIVKLPSIRDGSESRNEIEAFIDNLPKKLRERVHKHYFVFDHTLTAANVVIAFGSDKTIREVRDKLSPNQKFVAHGHAVSFLYLAEPDYLSPRQARACATDVLTYDQLGCLSPQAIYFPPGTDIESLGKKLALALETHWQKLDAKPSRPLSVSARIAEARDLAHAAGQRVWLPPAGHMGWTLIHDPEPTFQPSPLHGVIYLREVSEDQMSSVLASIDGRISTIGLAGRLSSRLENTFLNFGVSRFCPAGRMQFPPLTWHHDGRATLGELVTWVDAESLA